MDCLLLLPNLRSKGTEKHHNLTLCILLSLFWVPSHLCVLPIHWLYWSRGKEHRWKRTEWMDTERDGFRKVSTQKLEKELREMAKSDGWVPLYLKQGRRSPASPLPPPPLPPAHQHCLLSISSTLHLHFPLQWMCFHSCYAWESSKNTQRKSGYMVFRIGPRTETTLKRGLFSVSVCLPGSSITVLRGWWK